MQEFPSGVLCLIPLFCCFSVGSWVSFIEGRNCIGTNHSKNPSWSLRLHLIWRIWPFHVEVWICLFVQTGSTALNLRMRQWFFSLLMRTVTCMCQWCLMGLMILSTCPSFQNSLTGWAWLLLRLIQGWC